MIWKNRLIRVRTKRAITHYRWDEHLQRFVVVAKTPVDKHR